MSTKKETTTTNQYDASSMDIFHNLGAAGAKVAADYMKNPFMSEAFNARVQMGNRQALALGNRMKQNLLMGYTGSSPDAYQTSQLARVGRATAGMQAQNLLQNILLQEDLRTKAMGVGLSYQPLQTGQKSVEKTSGLGTWLPQVAGMAIGALTGGLGAGAMGMSGAMGAAKGAVTSSPGGMGSLSNLYGGKGW